jgi:hypothetical protein
MARAVLSSPLRWAGALVLAAAVFVTPAHGANQTVCSSKSLDPDIHAFQQQITVGAFYKELVLRFGKPLTCRMDVQEGRTNLTYTFRRGAQLIARSDPKAEFSEQRVDLIHMDSVNAIALLKRAESNGYRPGGCGISWTRSEEELPAGAVGTRELVYRSDTCNCQARLIFKGNYVVSVILRSAC